VPILWCPSSLLLGFPISGIRAFRVRRGVFCSTGANQFGDCLQFHSEVKILSFLFGFIFTNCLPHYVKKSIKKMVGESQSTVKAVQPHPMKIDVIKFDGTNNFGM